MIVAGKRLVVRTKLVGEEHISMASEWTRRGDEWYWRKVPELQMEPSDKPGTELIIYDVSDQVHDQLLDSETLVRDVSQMWFKVLEKGTTIRFGYGGQKFTKIGPPRFPNATTTESGQAVIRQRAKIPLSVSHRIVGELEDVAMYLAEDSVPSDLRGIALIKNGTQVIERLTSWGRKIPIEFQDRLFGWAVYYCSEERPFLATTGCERPGHRGFNPHTYYTKAKELLQQQVEDFLFPYAKAQLKPRLTERDRRRARENLQIIQKAFEENPDFNPWGGEGLAIGQRHERPTPDHPYISEIRLDKNSYARGETAHVTVVVLNPTSEYQPHIHLTVEGLDEGLSPLAVQELQPWDLPTMPPMTTETKGRIAPDIPIPITGDFAPGRNWIRCSLYNRPPPKVDGPPDGAEKQWDRGSHALWVEKEPDKRTRGPPRGGSGEDGTRPGTILNLVPITEAPLDPVENEVIPYWAAGEVWFFTRGARIGPVYERQPRTADSILYELMSESVAERVVQIRIDADTREKLEKAQVLEEFKRIEDLRRKFLRSCERLRAASEGVV
jgi:hypothetical protein